MDEDFQIEENFELKKSHQTRTFKIPTVNKERSFLFQESASSKLQNRLKIGC